MCVRKLRSAFGGEVVYRCVCVCVCVCVCARARVRVCSKFYDGGKCESVRDPSPFMVNE